MSDIREVQRLVAGAVPDGYDLYHRDVLFHAAVCHAAQVMWVARHGSAEHRQALSEHLSPTEMPQKWMLGSSQGPEQWEWMRDPPASVEVSEG